MDEARIKLAEAMGWTYTKPATEKELPWRSENARYRKDPPNPFTDANDCNALIKHLNGLGYAIAVHHHRSGNATVAIYYKTNDLPEKNLWSINNWMHGVCELALKAIESASNKDNDNG